MKKFFMAAMALVMAVGFTSCTQDDVVANEKMTFNFTVAEKPSLSGDSRATTFKTAWTNGDQIMIVFYNIATGWCTDQPLIIEYNGSSWIQKAAPTTEFEVSNVPGQMIYQAIHYRRADSSRNMSMTEQNLSRSYFKNIAGGEVLYTHGSYTLDETSVNVGEIALQYCEGLCLVTVPGLQASDGWRLGFLKDEPGEGVALYDFNFEETIIPVVEEKASRSDSNLLLDVGNLSTAFLKGFAFELATGVQNGNDVTFGFFPDVFTGDTYRFFLTNSPNSSGINYIYTITKSTEKTLKGGNAYLLPAIDTGKWTETTAYLWYEDYNAQ